MARTYTFWDEMNRMHEDLDSLFGSLLSTEPIGAGRQMIAAPVHTRQLAKKGYRQALADVWENDKEIVAAVELPGVDKKDIVVNSDDEKVEVKVEKKEEKEDKSKDSYSFQRSYQGFYRCFALPENADSSRIDAKYNNGVLELHVPKKQAEAKKMKQIEVK